MKIENIPDEVLEACHEFTDQQIEAMSVKTLFRNYCEWNGLQGWSNALWEVVTSLSKLQ